MARMYGIRSILSLQAQGLDRAAAEELEENDADDGDQDHPEAYNRLTQRM